MWCSSITWFKCGLTKDLPVLQAVEAGVGWPTNACCLLPVLPLHQLIINKGSLCVLCDLQQLHYLIHHLLQRLRLPCLLEVLRTGELSTVLASFTKLCKDLSSTDILK